MRKGITNIKKGVAVLLSACMVFGVAPVQAGTEGTEVQNTVSENIVPTEGTGSSEEKKEENTQKISRTMTVTAFAALDTSVMNQTLPVGASEADIKFSDTLTVTIRVQNESESADSVTANDADTADTADTTETSAELSGITWKMDETESDGAAFDSSEVCNGYCYAYTPVLPETDADGNSIQVADGVELPMIYVLIGEQQLMTLAAEAGHYDENGFCKGYEIDPNGTGAWVKKTGDDACTDADCNGYQPMTTVTEDGTEWYEISNAGQFYWFASQVDNGNLLDANVRLTADIVDNEGVTFGWDEDNNYAVVATKDGQTVDAKTLRMWNPIGDAGLNGKDFKGHFDGRGHLVSGLYYCKGNDICSGLFACAYIGAIIERIGIENSYIYGESTTGGIVGYVERCTIQQCYNAAYVLSDLYVGGIAGGSGTDHVTFKQDFNAGYIKNFDSDTGCIGQIYEVDEYEDRYGNLEMIDCYVMNDLNIPAIGNVSNLREGEVTFLSREDFYNGKAAYLLSWSTGLTWGQDLSSDNSLPNPCASDKYPVYKTCTGYTNDASKVHHSIVNGFCTNDGCDYYEEPHFNAADDVYEISNAGQLYAYADKAQRAYTKGARLIDDIIVNEETLIQEDGTPVTETSNLRTWKGLFREPNQALVQEVTFDGNNHSISGLYAKGSGLQGFVLYNYGTVKNLQIKNSVFISTDGKAGGIVGAAYDRRYTSKIENCSFEGYVEGAEYAGGIAGSNWNTDNCYADAYVKGSGVINPIVADTGSYGSINNTAYNTDKYTAECTTGGVKGFTTDQFASGEVAYALNQGSSDATTDTWKQTLDGESKDSTPTLNTSKENVYRYERLRCDGATKTTDDGKYGYTNDSSKRGKSIQDEHEYEVDSSDHTHHKCKVCGGVVAHDYTYQVADGTTDTIQAECDVCSDTYKVKLTAPAGADGKLTYTGTGLAARTEITDGVLGETLPNIEYATVTDGTTSAYSTDVPVNAGSYRARLTLGSGDNAVSATVDYTIAYLAGAPDAVVTDGNNKTYNSDAWCPSDIVLKAPDGYKISSTVNGSYEASFTYMGTKENETITYYLRADNSGEIAEKSVTVKMDRTAPDFSSEQSGINISMNWWNSLLGKITFGLYKGSLDVNIKADDSQSGVAEYYYYIDNSGSTTTLTAEELGTKTFTKVDAGKNGTTRLTQITQDSSYVFYAYAVDAVGNRSGYICSDGIVLDNTAPKLTFDVPDEHIGDNDAIVEYTINEPGTIYYFFSMESQDGAGIDSPIGLRTDVTFEELMNASVGEGYEDHFCKGTISVSAAQVGTLQELKKKSFVSK